MLVQLKVKNFALIEDALLTFEKGLNVLTGETGAGKSILMEALGFVLGNRFENEWLRSGKNLSVEAVFQIEKGSFIESDLLAHGVSVEESILSIRRECEEGGKTRSFLNGVLTTASQLKGIAPRLADIFSQGEGESLYDPFEQGLMLDVLAGLGEEIEGFRQIYEKRNHLSAEKKKLMDSLAQKEREMDLLQYQIKEIEAAQIHPEKDSELQELKIRLGSAEKLGKIYQECADKLSESEGSILSRTGQLNRILQTLVKIDTSQSVAKLMEEAESLEIRIGELSRSLDAYGDSLEHDPSRLEEVMERMDLLDRLKKKYGKTLEEVLEFLKVSKERLEVLESSDENLKKFDEEIEALEKAMTVQAKTFTEKRKKTALKIEKTVMEELESLEMKGARFKVEIAPVEFHSRGNDKIEFLLSANKGEALQPLAKVASGGEASRIQLALKRCFSQAQPVTTFIFDEIDSGIGGRLAPAIGEKLRRIAKDHTVISITHLAPVASHAGCHWRASKAEIKGATKIKFEQIDGDERVCEIAKMLSGKKLTETSIRHAKEILSK